MKRITSGTYYQTLENLGKIDWSRLDMTEEEVKQEVLWCYENEMDIDEAIQHFHWLIEDHNNHDPLEEGGYLSFGDYGY